MKLVIIRGLPGSGKTTTAREMFKGLAHCEADQYFYMLGGGEYKFDPVKLRLADEWCKRKVKRNLAAGLSCVVANTFVKVWEMRPYFDLAKTFGAEVEIYEATGNYCSVHNIPEEVIERMEKNWEPIACKFLGQNTTF